MNQLSGILSLIRFSNLAAPSPFSALPPVIYHNASPKAISGRTSYIRVRLEFLRYPQVIPGLFNGRRCGPPWSFTSTSTWTWIGHPVSGRMQVTSYALFRLAFAAAPDLQFLKLATYINSPDRSTKSTRSPVDGLSVLVSTRFQVLFHSPPGVLFTFPSQYCFSIGHWVVFRLGGWSPRLPTGFHVSRGTLDPARVDIPDFTYVALTLCMAALSHTHSVIRHRTYSCPKPRRYFYPRFGLFRVRSPLLAESRLISLPRPT